MNDECLWKETQRKKKQMDTYARHIHNGVWRVDGVVHIIQVFIFPFFLWILAPDFRSTFTKANSVKHFDKRCQI